MIEYLNLIPYIRYILASEQTRTDKILSIVGEDHFCSQILEDLTVYGFKIRYPFWGPPAEYQSTQLQVSKDQDIDSFLSTPKKQAFQAQFTLSPRYGLAENSFSFIHELIHFYQDMHGLFFTPILNDTRTPSKLDQCGTETVILFCESMAAVESIRIAHRLGGIVQRGAFASLNCGRLARLYKRSIQNGKSEKESALDILQAWHDSPQKTYYKKKATTLYERQKAEQEISVTLRDIMEHLPGNEPHLDYLRCFYETDIPQTKSPYPKTDIGSPVHLWYKMRAL